MARDGEEPWLEARSPIERGTPFEHAQPRLLHEVIDAIASAEQVDEIANEAMLEPFDERLEDAKVAPAQPKSNLLRFARLCRYRCHVAPEHTWCIRKSVADYARLAANFFVRRCRQGRVALRG